jgi:hypothetical protein
VSVRKNRCAILKYSGYDAASASPFVAERLLLSRKFDLIILSELADFDVNSLVNFTDGADVMVLEVLTTPAQLLSFLTQRLDLRRRP